MYSRYTPDGRGGYQRRTVLAPEEQRVNRDPPDSHPGQVLPLTDQEPIGTESRAAPAEIGRPPPGVSPQAAGQSRQSPGLPGPGRPRPFLPSHPSGPSGQPPEARGRQPGGLFSSLLGGLDWEDLLILAILVLCLKEDGADKTVIWIAAALYLLLGNGDADRF